jgi:hypothetical protein
VLPPASWNQIPSTTPCSQTPQITYFSHWSIMLLVNDSLKKKIISIPLNSWSSTHIRYLSYSFMKRFRIDRAARLWRQPSGSLKTRVNITGSTALHVTRPSIKLLIKIRFFKSFSTSHHMTWFDRYGHHHVFKNIVWWKLMSFRFVVPIFQCGPVFALGITQLWVVFPIVLSVITLDNDHIGRNLYM